MAGEEQQHHVRQRARSETAAEREMHFVADAPAGPFVVVEIERHGRVTALGMPAAATAGADEQLTRPAEDVDRLAVGAPDDVAGLEVCLSGSGWLMASEVVS